MTRSRKLLVVIAVFALVPSFAGAAQNPQLGSPLLPPSVSPPAQIGTLSAATPTLTFAGSSKNPTPLPLVNEPIPVVCAAECREFAFTAQTPQPFLASIHGNVPGHDGTFNANDGFNLYLYGPNKRLVAAANGIGADGQAVAVDRPTPGTYTIVVTFTYAEDPGAGYNGEVRLMSGTSWDPGTCTSVPTLNGCFDLPVLRALPAYDLTVSGVPPVASTPLGFPFPVNAATPNSCYTDESLGLGSPSVNGVRHRITRCLRFTSDVQNVGAGGLVVRIPWLKPDGTSGFLPGGCHAEQVLTDNGGRVVYRPAGDCVFHTQHAHFHYKDLVGFTLYTPGQATKVGSSLKESFCLADDEYFGFGTAGPNGARDFVGQPGCNLPSQAGSNGVYVTMGVSPGWGDVYTWDTPGQFIDISSVPAGDYDLVEKTNPDGSLLVGGDLQQTCALTRLQLTADTVKVLSTAPSIPCPA